MPQVNFSNIFNPGYLFDPAPAFSQNVSMVFNVLVVFLLLNILVYFLIKRAKFLAGVQKVIIRSWARINLILTLTGIVLIFFRSQGFRFLSMRVLLLAALLAIVINLSFWLVKLVRKKVVQNVQADSAESVSKYQDYLPKKRKK